MLILLKLLPRWLYEVSFSGQGLARGLFRIVYFVLGLQIVLGRSRFAISLRSSELGQIQDCIISQGFVYCSLSPKKNLNTTVFNGFLCVRRQYKTVLPPPLTSCKMRHDFITTGGLVSYVYRSGTTIQIDIQGRINWSVLVRRLVHRCSSMTGGLVHHGPHESLAVAK